MLSDFELKSPIKGLNCKEHETQLGKSIIDCFLWIDEWIA